MGAMFGRGPRARRGNVRAAILIVLGEEARNGYQIMQELEQRSGGQWKPSSGSVYPTLQQLEDEGLVEAAAAEAGSSRTFKLTAAGKKYVEANREELDAEDPRRMADAGGMAGNPRFELMMLFRQVAAAATQVAQTGTQRQIDDAKKLLAETRRKLYGLLAEEPNADDDGDE